MNTTKEPRKLQQLYDNGVIARRPVKTVSRLRTLDLFGEPKDALDPVDANRYRQSKHATKHGYQRLHRDPADQHKLHERQFKWAQTQAYLRQLALVEKGQVKVTL